MPVRVRCESYTEGKQRTCAVNGNPGNPHPAPSARMGWKAVLTLRPGSRCAAWWAVEPALDAAPFRLAAGWPAARFRVRPPGCFTSRSDSLAVGLRFAHRKALHALGNALRAGLTARSILRGILNTGSYGGTNREPSRADMSARKLSRADLYMRFGWQTTAWRGYHWSPNPLRCRRPTRRAIQQSSSGCATDVGSTIESSACLPDRSTGRRVSLITVSP